MGASVYGVGASVYGSLVILVSALGPNPSFFLFWGILLNRGLDLDQGLTKIFGIPFTLYIQKFEKNEVVNIFTYRPEWVNISLVTLSL